VKRLKWVDDNTIALAYKSVGQGDAKQDVGIVRAEVITYSPVAPLQAGWYARGSKIVHYVFGMLSDCLALVCSLLSFSVLFA
jgi:hypothetical protein